MGLGDLKDEAEEEEEEDVVDVEPQEKETEVQPATPDPDNTLIEPVGEPSEVAAMYEQFEEMKTTVLDMEKDTQKISGNRFVKKSGWRKLATAFNLTVETTEESRDLVDGVVVYTVKARAVAPNGKASSGVAKCASNEATHMEYLGDNEKQAMKKLEERGESTDNRDDVFVVDGAYRRLKPPREVNEHDIYATAATRAKNRAISDCVGGGEVSAEEITKEDVLG